MHYTKKRTKDNGMYYKEEEVTTLWEGCGWPWFGHGHGPSFLYNPPRSKRKQRKEKKKKHFDIYIGRSPKE